MSPLAWIRLHNHGWEYYQAFQESVFLAVQDLAFHTVGKKAGTIQLEYLTEDLILEKNLKLQNFLYLIEAHSQAMPYFPPVKDNAEVGRVFTNERKIRILWNAAHEKFKEELTNLHVVRFDQIGTWDIAIEKFRQAKERWNEKKALQKDLEETKKKNKSNPRATKNATRTDDRNSYNRTNPGGAGRVL